MIGGLAPLIVFHFESDNKILQNPIPIYLAEESGILAESATRSIDIVTKTENKKEYQKVEGNEATIVLRYREGNIAVTALIALLEKAHEKVDKLNYSMSLFWENIFILEGKLAGFVDEPEGDNDIHKLTVTVTKSPPEQQEVQQVIKKTAEVLKGVSG